MGDETVEQVKAEVSVFNDIGQSLFRRQNALNYNLDEINTSPLSRDYEAQFGHPPDINKFDYQRMYDRNPVAHRVVELYPVECWQQLPTIYDADAPQQSDFEKKINQVFQSTNMWGMMRRVDILSGIGNFGILLLGFSDGRPLDEPVQKGVGLELEYVRPFPHSQVEIVQSEQDRMNKRYGHPTMYRIQFQSIDQPIEGGFVDLSTRDVHWTRVVHIADNREVSEIYGVPRLQRCWNSLLDLYKILGSSGEMFYKGAYPGFSVEATDNMLGTVSIDADSIRAELEKYENNLQRVIALKNARLSPISSNYADPTGFVEAHLNQIAVANAVPVRILLGSERGELASSQDAVIWKKRLMERQISYITPFLIRPVVVRSIQYGIVPMPYNKDFHVEWPDLSTDTQEQKYAVREKQLQFLSQYRDGGLDRFFAPVPYMMHYCDMTESEAKSFVDEAEKMRTEDIEAEAARLVGGDGGADSGFGSGFGSGLDGGGGFDGGGLDTGSDAI